MAKAGKRTSSQTPQAGTGSRQAILEAALRTFARNGYDGASIPAIARLAAVAPPLVHYYFETKERLWRETVDYSLGGLQAEAVAVLRATRSFTPLDRLRALLQVYAEFATRCPDHFSMIVAEARADSDRFAWLQDNYTGLLFEEVVSILDEARAAGVVRDIPVRDLAVILIGGILVHFTIYPSAQKTPADTPSAPGFVDFLFELLTRGVLAQQ